MPILDSAVPGLQLELALYAGGIGLVAGLDEAGRGAWAGPVVAGAVILPLGQEDLSQQLPGVRDSKQMSAVQRDTWLRRLEETALGISSGVAEHGEVDRLGVIGATRLAMVRALQSLQPPPQYLLIDHLLLPDSELQQTALPYGDSQVLSIAAASIVAKVTRDRLMSDLERQYPGYGFAAHKGYGTAQHRAALEILGPTPIHRMSYSPLAMLASRRTSG